MDRGIQPLETGCFAVTGGRFSAVGEVVPASRKVDLGGHLVLPGLVDCHTHLVFAGDRATEHARRLDGASYEEISRAGGGIMSTVEAVRRASEDQLVELAVPRALALIREGVTVIEIKSGYGLDLENEVKMLGAIRRLGERIPARVCATFLGAHAVPHGRTRAGYMDEVVEEMLPAIAEAKLADAVDIFVERIGFDLRDLERLAERVLDLGLPLRVHSEQFSHMGGTAAGARLGALSCDHLEYADDRDIASMSEHGTVAVLLPGAYYFLRESRRPPVEAMRRAGVPMAVASDFNPGSSPLASLLISAHMACTLFGLTAAEAIGAITRNASMALGLQDSAGRIATGLQADFTVWDLPGPEHLVYQLGGLRPAQIYVEGEPV